MTEIMRDSLKLALVSPKLLQLCCNFSRKTKCEECPRTIQIHKLHLRIYSSFLCSTFKLTLFSCNRQRDGTFRHSENLGFILAMDFCVVLSGVFAPQQCHLQNMWGNYEGTHSVQTALRTSFGKGAVKAQSLFCICD